MQALLDSPIALAALVGALASALVNLAVAVARGFYRLYRLRLGSALEPAIELDVSSWIEQGEEHDLLHCIIRLHNVGEVRAVPDSGVLYVAAPIVAGYPPEERWLWDIAWAEPIPVEAFEPGVLPGLVLRPGEPHEERRTMGLAKGAPSPLKVTLEVAQESFSWSSVGTAAREVLAGEGNSGHNPGEYRRR